MIPRPGPKVEALPPLELYREDLDKLVAIFKEHCPTVTFGDEENVYETLDEMEGRSPARLKCFLIAGVAPHAELVIRGTQSVPLGVQRSTLWIVEKSDKAELLFLSVKEFLHKRRWMSRIVFRYTALYVGTLMFFACFFAKSLLRPHYDLGLDLGALASSGLVVVFALMNAKQVSYATLRLRAKSQSFWERNSDKFATVIISTILGGLGTLALQWLRRVLLSR